MVDNSDQALLEQLQGRLVQLRENERSLVKIQGINETLAKARVDQSALEDKATAIKKEIGEIEAERDSAVNALSKGIEDRMRDMVSGLGNPVIKVDDDGGLVIGIASQDASRLIPAATLSGGERVVFDAALAFALAAPSEGFPIIIVEAAEADPERLSDVVVAMSGINGEAQFFVSSWVDPFNLDILSDDHIPETEKILIEKGE